MPVADAEPVFRCAYRLAAISEDVRTAAARTAGAYPADWRGTAGIAYQQRLDETANRVRRAAAAYDAAGAALLPYARALLDVAALEQRAQSLLAEAADADRRAAAAASALGVERLAGPSPAEGFRAAAARLQVDAAEVDRRAAAVCAAALEDEAARAPAPSGWQKADRFAGDLMQYGAQTVAGTFSLLGSAWHALPGIGSSHSRHQARHDLAESAVAAAQIWNIPIDIAHAFEDGRPGLAVAGAAGFTGAGRLSEASKIAALTKRQRKAMEHWIADPDVAHEEAFRQVARHELVAGHAPYRQSADDMLRNGISLVNEEAIGGHTLREHVGAGVGYLAHRIRQGRPAASTFDDAIVAERAVNAVLQQNHTRLHQVYALADHQLLELVGCSRDEVGEVLLPGAADTVRTNKVRVFLGLEGGHPYVRTAYPEV